MEIIERDILDVRTGAIAHQVNCRGCMGAGLALQIRKAYPRVFARYRALCRGRGDPGSLMGTVQPVWANASRKLLVLNLFAQHDISRDRAMTDLDALGAIAQKLRIKQQAGELGEIHLPWKLGCGLGGGDWEAVEPLFTDVRGCWCRKPEASVRVLNGYRDGWTGDRSVYIGRCNAKLGLEESPLHNPFRIGGDGDRDRVVARYADYLRDRLGGEVGGLDIRAEIDRLREMARSGGVDLVCYCAPRACHGDVIRDIILSPSFGSP